MSVPPRCKCGEVALRRTVRKEGPTFDKPFYCCPSLPQCGFFQWLHDPLSPAALRAKAAQASLRLAAAQPSSGASTLGSRLAAACAREDDLRSHPIDRTSPSARPTSGVAAAALLRPHATAPIPPGPSVGGIAAAASAAASPASLEDLPPNSSMPPHLWQSLYSFQREAVRFALARRSRALIADEMGLGKTRTAIAIAAHHAPLWPVLVLCPSSLRLTWKDELLDALFGVLSEENSEGGWGRRSC
jgi:hypothetical protein